MPNDSLLTINDALLRLRIGRTKLYQLCASGQLNPVKIGAKTYLAESDLARFIAELPRAQLRTAKEAA